MTQTTWHCPDCGRDRLFEQHHAAGDCPDSADGECPEWACTECGAALLSGFTPGCGEVAWEPARRVA